MKIDSIKEELIKKALDPSAVLDFSNSEFNKEFQSIVDFYNETIENHYIYKIHKSVFFIENETLALNATATCHENVNFNSISITGGLILFLIKTFIVSHGEINKQIDSIVSADTSFIEEKYYFQYVSVTHFVIYHEIAHLIQFGSQKLTYIEEFSSNKEEYKHEKHILELDADEFAALSLGSHLIQYFHDLKKTKNELGLHNISDYVTVSLGAIFIVMVNLHSDFEQFYIDRRTHPHPITRLVLLSSTLIEYLNQTFIKENYEKKLNPINIIDKSIGYANSYNVTLKGNRVLEMVPKIIRDELENIMKYIAKIRNDAEKMNNLAVKAWNENITEGTTPSIKIKEEKKG